MVRRARSDCLAAAAALALISDSRLRLRRPPSDAQSGPQQADKVTIGVNVDEGTLTPTHNSPATRGNNLIAFVYDKLPDRTDNKNELKPLLASGFKGNAGNTAFTVPLRTDVTWHDG